MTSPTTLNGQDLRAASPELYMACRDALQWLEAAQENEEEGHIAHNRGIVIDEIKAALAKAEGRSE